jgi:hypothetical protein
MNELQRIEAAQTDDGKSSPEDLIADYERGPDELCAGWTG